MDNDSILRQQLVALLRGQQAHMPYDAAVADFPLEAINREPAQVPYTPWHLLEHLRLAQWDILDFIRNPNYSALHWPEDYWPERSQQADEARWNATIAGFKADQQALQDLVMNPSTDLTGDIPHAPGYNILREILVVSDHNAYHIGEFAILRQVMGTWPANHGIK